VAGGPEVNAEIHRTCRHPTRPLRLGCIPCCRQWPGRLSEPQDLDAYARAGAAVAGLSIDEAWWPAVLRHLGILLDHAAVVEAFDSGENPAPVFQP
jgi:hypothetical protein